MKSLNIGIGTRFGAWTVIGPSTREARRTPGGTNYVVRYPCRCDCGTERAVRAFKLLSNSKSCGCQTAAQRPIAHGENRVGKRTRLYSTWDGMRQRCSNPRHYQFMLYGGRGITVCPEWSSFQSFQQWALASGHQPGLQIDRIDNDRGYSPDNCRWVTDAQNKRNTSVNQIIEAYGERKCATDWALDPRATVKPGTMVYRMRKLNMAAEEAISSPRRTRKSAGRFEGNHVTSRRA